MFRTWTCLAASAVFAMLAGSWAPSAMAASKDEIFAACASSLKEEFGASPFEFEKVRRSGGRQYAFGEVTLPDGSTQQIRCQVRNGNVDHVRFRKSGGATTGNAWTDDRPEGAEYVPFEDEVEAEAETEAETEAEAGTTTTTAAATPADGDDGEQAVTEGEPETQADGGATEQADGGDAAEAEEEAKQQPASRFKRAPVN